MARNHDASSARTFPEFENEQLSAKRVLRLGGLMSGQVSKKRFEKHLKIGIRFDNGSFVLLNGQPLPKLANGSVGELVIAPECIENVAVREGFKGEQRVPFLKKGEYVLLGMRDRK